MYKCVGILKKEITSKNTGNKYRAAYLHCVLDNPGKVVGTAVEVIFVKEEVLPAGFGVGTIFMPLYNRWGSVVDIQTHQE